MPVAENRRSTTASLPKASAAVQRSLTPLKSPLLASACVTNAMTFVGIRAAFAFAAACRKAPLSAMYIHRLFEPCRSVLK